jgi:hypothetical protein
MMNARVFCAGVAVGVSAVGAIWLFTYQESSVFRFIDVNGNEFHAARIVHVQPWWSVFGAFALLLLGVAAAIALLPEGPGALTRFVRAATGARTRVARRAP